MPRTTKNGQIHVVRIMQSMNDKFFVIQGATTGSARMLGSYQFASKMFIDFNINLHLFFRILVIFKLIKRPVF